MIGGAVWLVLSLGGRKANTSVELLLRGITF